MERDGMEMRRRAWLVILLLLWSPAGIWGAAEAPTEARTLVLHRPVSRGQSYGLDLRLEGHSKGTMGIGESTSGQSQSFRLDLSGQVKAVSVNPQGEPTLLVLSVAKAQLSLDGKDHPLDLNGVDLGVSFPSGKVHFTRKDGKALAKEAEGLLSQAFSPPDGLQRDEAFGPGRAVKPGESWTLKPEILAQVLASGAQGESKPGPSNLEGTMTYVGPEPWEGMPCSHLRTALVVKDLKVPNFVGSIRMEVTEDLWLPEESSSIRSHRVTTVANDLWGKFLSGDGKALDIKSKDTLTLDVTVR